jgi:hypothetical protein
MNPTPLRRNVRTYAALHPMVYGTLGLCTLWIVAAIWVFFGHGLYSAVQLAVATVFAAMFLGIPLVLSRLAGRRNAARPKLREWLDGEFEILDGSVDARHAVMMVFIAPVACVAGITAIGLIAWLVSIGVI